MAGLLEGLGVEGAGVLAGALVVSVFLLQPARPKAAARTIATPAVDLRVGVYISFP